MNSAKELNQAHQNAAFEKAKQKVIAVLIDDPFGLTLSQLMTKCKLSVKTVKQVLCGDEFSKDGLIFTLKDHISPVPSADQVQQPAPDRKFTFIERAIKMFKAHPEGVTLDEALTTLNCMRGMFDTELTKIRKYHFPVVLEKQEDGRKLYIPKLDVDLSLPVQTENVPVEAVDLPVIEQEVDQNLPIQPETVPVTADALPNVDEAILHKNEDLPHKTEYLPDLVAVNDVEKTALLECKNMVQTQTFQKSEVYLDLDQINILLTQLFDLNDVKWCTTGARVDGVHLSKVQAI